MLDPTKQPKYWRVRAHATRARAKQMADPREIKRLLRVAEEYDKIAERVERWRRAGAPREF